MIYLVSQDWANTSNNHAGIKYLCNKLQEMYPGIYRSIVIPCYMDDRILSTNRIVRKFQCRYARYQIKCFSKRIIDDFALCLRPNDVVFLMEYYERVSPMKCLADSIRSKFPFVNIWAMAHLIPSKLSSMFPNDSEFTLWMKNVDKIFTLGQSLSNYLLSRGIAKEKIETTFHYVDNYYLSQDVGVPGDRVKVIAMGNQARNIELLHKVVKSNSSVDFIICQGVMDLKNVFSDCSNVNLIPFVPEPDLRSYMESADISLNVMQDTIGSNVIVTSLAMGLAMVCSDVGSIRDYCDEKNTIFCGNNSVESFSNSIKALSLDKDLLMKMKKSAQKRGELYSIEKFHLYLMSRKG